MIRGLRILSYYLIFLFIGHSVNGQNSVYKNFSFEYGDFTNWEGYTWQYESRLDEPYSVPTKNIVHRRHEIISDVNAFDKNTGNQLKLIPPGYKYSVRLGDSIRFYDDTIRNWRQSLQYTMVVDTMHPLITIKFALVLENYLLHDISSEQHFSFSILDKDKKIVQSCANFDVFPSARQFNDFQYYYLPYQSNPNRENFVGWKDWTTVVADLSDFIGQSVTLELLSEDCILPFPEQSQNWSTCFGYAYFATSSQALKLKQENCDANSDSKLIAPEGFETYLWKNSENKQLGYSRTLDITYPLADSVYFCEMTTFMGCETRLGIRPDKGNFIPKANFTSEYSCDSNIVQFINNSMTDGGSLSYVWNFGDGITSTDSNPRQIYSNSGFHDVSLVVINSSSGCTDQVSKKVESFSPLEITISGTNTYCPGESTWIKAFGTSECSWSNGSTADSIEISAPGGEYWMIGNSSDKKCSTDTIYHTITEEPDWNFRIDGDTILCQGEKLILTAYGAYQQKWWDGTNLSSIAVSDAGSYYCIGQNMRGCSKTAYTHLSISPPPNANFTLSDTIVSFKDNEITAIANIAPNTNYVWDMGDGQDTKTGATITHSYEYFIPGKAFICTLEATNEFGCKNYTSNEIIVIPFIPNVFSPNNDGINDLFMVGADIEIFDRHGKIYYKGSDGWDGNFHGQPADPDTYFYTVTYSFTGIATQVKKGYLTLIR